MENHKLISLDDALRIAFENAKALDSKLVDFTKSAGRILAEPVYSDVDMPPFNKSAMDGYACKKEDLGKLLEVLEVIPAGQSPSFSIAKGQCSKIMTGAEVPEGADTVFMVEQSQQIDANHVRFAGEKTRSNICLIGEDLKTGELVLNAGTKLGAQHIAMLAAVGCVAPRVYRKPKVGIISTGSELVEPERKPAASQIRNSNGHQLSIQAKACQFEVNYYGIVKDDRKMTYEAIKKSTDENDVTLISGGVSVGDFDFVPAIIEELNFQILFSQLTVKPGKHTTFAVNQNKYIIGLPGNPVSSFIQFEIFAKPFIYKLLNYEETKLNLPFPLAKNYKRRRADRTEYVPVMINEQNEAVTIDYHGSAHIHAYHGAFGFMTIPLGTNELQKGETVYVRPL